MDNIIRCIAFIALFPTLFMSLEQRSRDDYMKELLTFTEKEGVHSTEHQLMSEVAKIFSEFQNAKNFAPKFIRLALHPESNEDSDSFKTGTLKSYMNILSDFLLQQVGEEARKVWEQIENTMLQNMDEEVNQEFDPNNSEFESDRVLSEYYTKFTEKKTFDFHEILKKMSIAVAKDRIALVKDALGFYQDKMLQIAEQQMREKLQRCRQKEQGERQQKENEDSPLLTGGISSRKGSTLKKLFSRKKSEAENSSDLPKGYIQNKIRKYLNLVNPFGPDPTGKIPLKNLEHVLQYSHLMSSDKQTDQNPKLQIAYYKRLSDIILWHPIDVEPPVRDSQGELWKNFPEIKLKTEPGKTMGVRVGKLDGITKWDSYLTCAYEMRDRNLEINFTDKTKKWEGFSEDIDCTIDKSVCKELAHLFTDLLSSSLARMTLADYHLEWIKCLNLMYRY